MKRRSLILELKETIIVTDESEIMTGVFDGKSFCITGSLSRPRKEIIFSIKSVGGKVVNSISKNLDYLVVGESAGSKLEKAKTLDITILSEKDLYNLISSNQEKSNQQMSLSDY